MKRTTIVGSLAFLFLFSSYCDSASAATLTNIYVFTAGNDGYDPNGVVQGSDGNLYGTTAYGGTNADCGTGTVGTVFKISPSGGTFTTLCSFPSSDSRGPYAGGALVQGSDGNFYGTTSGWACSDGTVFKVSPNGSFTTLCSVDGYPEAWLVQGSDGNFYGTTAWDSDSSMCGAGSVFSISTSGSLTTLHCFSSDGSEGAGPIGALVQGSDSNFYGVAHSSGENYVGTLFRITPSGTFATLHQFDGTDGAGPLGLVRGVDGNFYGITESGGPNWNSPDPDVESQGNIFRITPSGSFTDLYDFSGSDNASADAWLTQGSDGNFYGVTMVGGSNLDVYGGAYGEIFRISPSGDYTNLYEFGGGDGDGRYPNARLTQGCDGNFYGTTIEGGGPGHGVIFKLIVPFNSLNPPPNQVSAIQIVGSNVVITVPSIFGEHYQLQYRNSMTDGSWSDVVGASVSNSIGGPLTLIDYGGAVNTQRFYRVDVFACSADAYSDPVGFVTLTAEGTNAPGSPAYSFLGLGLTQIPALRGVVGTVSGTQVPLDSPLSPGQYNSVSNGPLYYIEVTSGTSAGFTDDVVSNDAVNVFTANDDSSVIANGSTYKLYPHWTIASVFGTTDQVGLDQGASGDQILVQNPVTQTFSTYYYTTATKALTAGWKSAGSGNADAAQTPLYNNQGILINRQPGTNLTFKSVGAVKLGPTIVPLFGPGNQIPANVYAAAITLSNSGLYTDGVSTDSFVFGSDYVLIHDDTAGVYNTYFYTTATKSLTAGWKQSGTGNTDAGGTMIAVGSSILIQLQSGHNGFNWKMPAPY
ncbi:MAG TPA: choice-of-anchor tandem repeat GloVer-containing protein [Verrucomicrobiae bacterium]|nr:choice-of-anchor tandem repeat GloVer-containing protein [Verrucomicrobiae bacterium]